MQLGAATACRPMVSIILPHPIGFDLALLRGITSFRLDLRWNWRSCRFVTELSKLLAIRRYRVSAATGCNILGKAEFMNPGQSVKDRAALFIIQDAVKKGALRPGGL